MKRIFKHCLLLVTLVLAGLFALAGCGSQDTGQTTPTTPGGLSAETENAEPTESAITEDGTYSSKEEVALYIHTYHKLPSNYISKKEAQDLGWVSSKGNLWEVAPGKSIGGDHFGNYQNKLPAAKGREYHECDIDFDGSYRNAKRIIYSDDGLIFYTEDHYNTFEQLY